MFTVFQTIH